MTKVEVATSRSSDPQRDAIELFWVCGGLFLLVSNQLFDPVLGIVGVVVFGRREVSEIAVEALRVEPVDPPQRGELNVGDRASGSLVGSVDQLGL